MHEWTWARRIYVLGSIRKPSRKCCHLFECSPHASDWWCAFALHFIYNKFNDDKWDDTLKSATFAPSLLRFSRLIIVRRCQTKTNFIVNFDYLIWFCDIHWMSVYRKVFFSHHLFIHLGYGRRFNQPIRNAHLIHLLIHSKFILCGSAWIDNNKTKKNQQTFLCSSTKWNFFVRSRRWLLP